MQRKSSEFEAWLAKYEPVEQAILAARDKRFENRRKRAAQRAKHFGDLCEMTEGRAKTLAREDRAKTCATEGRAKTWTSAGRAKTRAIRDRTKGRSFVGCDQPWTCGDRAQIRTSTDDAETRMRGNGIQSLGRPSIDSDPLVLTDVAIAVLAPYLRCVRTAATKYVKRLTDAARRPLYYEHENARRRALAAARRKVVKRETLNACPTREAILDAWVHRHDSHEASIRFGGLIMDLECYLDNSLLFAENGAICGRRGGVKRWLQTEIPALYLCYGTVMRYKAHAAKLRQIVELADPIPVSRILQEPASQEPAPQEAAPQEAASQEAASQDPSPQETPGVSPNAAIAREAHGSESNATMAPNEAEQDYVAETKLSGRPSNHDLVQRADSSAVLRASDAREQTRGNQVRTLVDAEQVELRVLRGRAIWLEVIAGIKNNPTALMARIDALLDPENISEATLLAGWRAKCENEITLRRLRSWRRRLFGRRGRGENCA